MDPQHLEILTVLAIALANASAPSLLAYTHLRGIWKTQQSDRGTQGADNHVKPLVMLKEAFSSMSRLHPTRMLPSGSAPFRPNPCAMKVIEIACPTD